MENRLTRAVRVLLGNPLGGTSVGGAFLLDRGPESEHDHAKLLPFDLAFGGVVDDGPPTRVIEGGRFRVCIFRAKQTCECCGAPVHWLTCELRGKGRWHHLVTLHESNLDRMRCVLDDVASYVRDPA